jgi:hypothetical protein
MLIPAASLATVFHLIPHTFPFFSPDEWPPAAQADFLGQIGFLSHFLV